MSERYSPPDQDDVDDVWAYDGDLDLDPSDERLADGLSHVSKSRIKTFLTCPRQFAYTYWGEEREPGNFYTERGSQIHEVFETFYEQLAEYVETHDERPERFYPLMQTVENWSQWIDYYGPFWEFEERRFDAAIDSIDGRITGAADIRTALYRWLPVGIEDELRVEDPPVGDLEWMGPYDALFDSRSIPDDLVASRDGVTVVDFKSGSMKDKEAYKETGIYIDLEFYAWMLEENGYEVDAGIGFYPGAPGYEVREMPNPDTRERIATVVEQLHEAPTVENYPVDQNPLCSYCHFYDQCPSRWDE